jgi:hypothetical protein
MLFVYDENYKYYAFEIYTDAYHILSFLCFMTFRKYSRNKDVHVAKEYPDFYHFRIMRKIFRDLTHGFTFS